MQFEIAERTMWDLVQTYIGLVGYQRGMKSEGLLADPPVIDCSGWTRLLLTKAMHAQNEAAARAVFGSGDVKALQVWSDRIIQEIETRTGFVLVGDKITATLKVKPHIGIAWGRHQLPFKDISPIGLTSETEGKFAYVYAETRGRKVKLTGYMPTARAEAIRFELQGLSGFAWN